MMVTRADVDALWTELVDRSLRTSAEVLLSAGLRPQNLDGIAMVGGTTWVPKVRRDVERVLGRPLTGELDPQTAVAAGAAMVAARAAELNAA
jgi:molecular chaperone DnaK (HSP70)